MSDTANVKTKRGDKQLIALKYMNALSSPDYTLEDLTGPVGKETGLNEAGARHLIRYLVKYQDRDAPGKTKTLREQGRVIAPVWYTPVAVDPNYPNDGSETYKAHMAAVADLQPVKIGERPLRRALGYLDFPLEKPAGRKTPIKKETSDEAKTTKEEKRGTPERRAAIAAAFSNWNAKKTTKTVEELAKAGAHKFANPTTETIPVNEGELTD